MRSIVHPGPVSAERFLAVACRAQPATLTLEAGRSINEAAAEALARAGFSGGYVRLKNARVEPLRYVIPAASPDGSHAAWYSDSFAPEGPCLIEDAGLVVGRRDGAPFLHCHGIWRLADGTRRMGHLLPLDSRLAGPADAECRGMSGALFEARDDAETAFRLFRPEATGGDADGARAVACAVRPNIDIGEAVEAVCRRHGIADAAVHGIGSLVGADLEDGSAVSSYATEVLVTRGRVSGGRATLDIALVGMDGSIAEGRLVPGVNPVCVTFELLIVEQPGG